METLSTDMSAQRALYTMDVSDSGRESFYLCFSTRCAPLMFHVDFKETKEEVKVVMCRISRARSEKQVYSGGNC